MSYHAAIFDMDGTLVDSLADIAGATNHLRTQFELAPLPVERYRYLAGQGAEYLIRESLGDMPAADMARALTLWRDYYGKHKFDHTRLFPGIAEMLSALAGHGLKLAIFSNKPHEPVVQIADRLLGDHDFEIVRGAKPGFPVKPDPTVAFHIIDELGLTAAQCVYVGDTKADMLTGKRSGMFTIGVTWGFRPRSELEENGADVIVDEAGEITELVAKKLQRTV